MALRPRFIRRVLALFRWQSRDRDMDREMAFHIDSLARDYARDGLREQRLQRAPALVAGEQTGAGHDAEDHHDQRREREVLGLQEDARVAHASLCPEELQHLLRVLGGVQELAEGREEEDHHRAVGRQAEAVTSRCEKMPASLRPGECCGRFVCYWIHEIILLAGGVPTRE